MRFSLCALSILTLAAACVDAPITPAHLAADGQLRANMAQQMFNGEEGAMRAAERLQLTAVLAAEAGGALQDTAVFQRGADKAVYLHLRADNIKGPRALRFEWSHGDKKRESMDFVLPARTLTAAAELPLVDAAPGRWTVEVYPVTSHGEPPLLFRREFEVRSD